MEIVVGRLTDEAERAAVQCGAEIEYGAQAMRLLVDAAPKREAIEKLWLAGLDVISVNLVKNSLEKVFLTVVGESS